MAYRIKTIVGVNVRQGPSISFDIIDNIDHDTILDASEFVKDGSGVGWFKIGDKQYICSKFVTTNFKEEKPSTLVRNVMKTNAPEARADFWETLGTGITSGGSYTSSIMNAVKSEIITGQASNINAGIFGNIFDGVTGGTGGDIILKRRLFGAPFQFLDTTDARPGTGGTDAELGLFFQNSIMLEAPILSILPGRPDYLANLSTESKKDLTETFFNLVSGAADKLSEMTSEALDLQNIDIKYFEFSPQPTQYMNYVNLLCRMSAMFMGIGDQIMPGTGIPYKDFRWENYTMGLTYAQRFISTYSNQNAADVGEGLAQSTGSIINKVLNSANTIDGIKEGFAEGVNTVAPLNMESYYVDFYITPSMSFNESFSNSTGESALSSTVGKASNLQKELMFLFGATGYNSTTIVGEDFEKNIDRWKAEADKLLDSTSGSRVIERLLTGATSVITGSNIVFPDIWQDSSFDRSYQFEIKLVAPYATRECIFLEIIVPLMHLIAAAVPCQSTANTYSSPFLIRSVLPGFFSSEMGIIQDMTINKGGSGDSWSVDGFPTEVTVSLSIKDLYNSLYQSKLTSKSDAYNLLWNSGLIDYIGTQCGLNMKKSEYAKKLETAYVLAGNIPQDLLTNLGSNLKESIARNTLSKYIGLGGK